MFLKNLNVFLFQSAYLFFNNDKILKYFTYSNIENAWLASVGFLWPPGWMYL
jgi:hypothetical protein